MNKKNKQIAPAAATAGNGVISITSDYQITVRDLSNPTTLTQFVVDMKDLSGKRKIDFRELQLVLQSSNTTQDIADGLSRALLSADDQTALSLWDSFGANLKHYLVVFDDGVLNTDLVRKLDLEGGLIRKAFLDRGSIAPPGKTAYAYIHGDSSVEAAHELVHLLKQMKKLKPDGNMLVSEFFDNIDLRVLYLFAVHEAEWFEEFDGTGGAYLQLAIESCDTVPAQALFLSWIQENVPDIFLQLREELLNPVYQENRTMFWKSWSRHNRPDFDPDYYERMRGGNYLSRVAGDMEDPQDLLDELLNLSERDSQ